MIAVANDGGRIAYAVAGPHAAAPLLLLRPLGGTTTLWGPFAERLAQEFRVVTFDYRGMGASGPAPLRPTTRSLARDALTVLDDLKLAQTHVFGISLGGMAATMLAAEAPERVVRLVLASAPAKGRALIGRDFKAALRMSGCFARRRSQVEPCLVRHVLSPGFKQNRPAEVVRISALVAQSPASPATLLKNMAAAIGHDASALLPMIRTPSLVLAGADDALLGPDVVRQVADQIPGSRFEVASDTGHDLTLEDPLGTAARVAAFLKL